MMYQTDGQLETKNMETNIDMNESIIWRFQKRL